MHIGAEKTGTTSVQQWFMRNRKALLQRRGILFPETPGKFNHVALSAYALDVSHGMEELRVVCGANKHPSVEAFREQFINDLEAEIIRTDPRRIVFSNEHCSSRLRTLEEITRLRDLLYRFSPNVRIVLYIREPVSFFASWYSTMIASGGTAPFPNRPEPHFLNAANWLGMIQMWADVFGPQALTIRRYDRKLFPDFDPIRDVCSLLNLPSENFAPVPAKNESLGLLPLLFLRKLNPDLPRIKDGAMNQERGNIVPILRTFPDPRRYSIPGQTARLIQDHFAESYAELKRVWFPDETGPLFSEPDLQSAGSESTSLSEDELLALTRHLWINRRTKFQ